jgi:hypothetical protein
MNGGQTPFDAYPRSAAWEKDQHGDETATSAHTKVQRHLGTSYLYILFIG